MIRPIDRFLTVLLLAAALPVSAQFGNGAEGPLIVTSGTRLLTQSTTTLFSSVAVGATQIRVVSTSGFPVGSEVILLGIYGGESGKYEFAVIESIQSFPAAFNLVSPTINSYSSFFTTTVVRVPNYSSVTVAEGATLSAAGPVLAFRCLGAMTIDGHLTADGWGYDGGRSRMAFATVGFQGSSYDGTPMLSGAANFGAGGGGGAVPPPAAGASAGGGGGSHATSGQGGEAAPPFSGGLPGVPYGLADCSLLSPGSGGGGGGFGGLIGNTTAGGDGGGVIYVAAASLEIGMTGVVSARGLDGQNGSPFRAAGGGGAGGAIYLVSGGLAGAVNEGLVSASGGEGGIIDPPQQPGTPYEGAGGAGGDGYIRIDGPLTGAGSVAPTPFLGTAPLAASDWIRFE